MKRKLVAYLLELLPLFGVRNFENLDAGIKEIFRVLKPGGIIAVLEFGQRCVIWYRCLS